MAKMNQMIPVIKLYLRIPALAQIAFNLDGTSARTQRNFDAPCFFPFPPRNLLNQQIQFRKYVPVLLYFFGDEFPKILRAQISGDVANILHHFLPGLMF